MRARIFDTDDLVLSVLSYLDQRSLVNIGSVSARLSALAKTQCLWLDLSLKNPLVAMLVFAIDKDQLQIDLKNNTLNARHFLQELARKNFSMCQLLLGAYQSISLYFPSYETEEKARQPNSLVFKSEKEGYPRKAYLTQEIAERKINNIAKVKGFFSARMPITRINFKALCENGVAYYSEAIEQKEASFHSRESKPLPRVK